MLPWGQAGPGHLGPHKPQLRHPTEREDLPDTWNFGYLGQKRTKEIENQETEQQSNKGKHKNQYPDL